MMRRILPFLFFVLPCSLLHAQHLFELDGSAQPPAPVLHQLEMGNSGPEAKAIEVNNQYLTLGGKPVLPVMGEVHFSRLPRSSWEDVLLKMKANGVNIIACYVLWIHHEEQEGQFEWTGNKDLRAFVQLCQKLGLYVYPRIGPWCHAEVRNGGTPDWLLAKKGIRVRTNDPQYQHYVALYFDQIAAQLKGLLYKDGGPVIGIQLENEYRHGKAGEAHIKWLKHTAMQDGLDVPLYTVTGWGNASVPARAVIPLWGAYPDAPWATNLLSSQNTKDFQFSPYRNDEKIGNEKGDQTAPAAIDPLYPYFTCEMGVGVENTDHRRVEIGRLDGEALILAKLGSGSNLIGYYMFAGGSNPHGTLTSMEETQLSGSWNTNPAISYDFQAAIRETGALGPSYAAIKPIHYFLNAFGARLAPMAPVFSKADSDFQYCLRSSGSSGFLFGMNYCRHQTRQTVQGAQFNIRLKGEQIRFPRQGMDIPDSSLFIWPLNFKMGGLLLKYATAMPVGEIGVAGVRTWVFGCNVSDDPEFCLDDRSIRQLKCPTASITHQDGHYIIHAWQKGDVHRVQIEAKDGKRYQLVLLSRKAVGRVWLLRNSAGEEVLYLSKAGLYAHDGRLHVFGAAHHFDIRTLGAQPLYLHQKRLKPAMVNGLWNYHVELPDRQQADTVRVTPLSALADASWLRVSTDKLNAGNLLYHKFFLKKIALNNPSAIRSVTMYLAGGKYSSLLVNNHPVNQDNRPGKGSRLDLTGYFQKGENTLLIGFQADTAVMPFAAHVLVQYENNDREDICTDSSWLTRFQYAYPAYPYGISGFGRPEMARNAPSIPAINGEGRSYRITVNGDSLSLSNAVLAIQYAGDKARLYKDGVLVADNFSDGQVWKTSLGRIGVSASARQTYLLTVQPLEAGARKYFEAAVDTAQMEEGLLKEVRLLPVYQTDLDERQ